jgi:cell division protein FtsL
MEKTGAGEEWRRLLLEKNGEDVLQKDGEDWCWRMEKTGAEKDGEDLCRRRMEKTGAGEEWRRLLLEKNGEDLCWRRMEKIGAGGWRRLVLRRMEKIGAEEEWRRLVLEKDVEDWCWRRMENTDAGEGWRRSVGIQRTEKMSGYTTHFAYKNNLRLHIYRQQYCNAKYTNCVSPCAGYIATIWSWTATPANLPAQFMALIFCPYS